MREALWMTQNPDYQTTSTKSTKYHDCCWQIILLKCENQVNSRVSLFKTNKNEYWSMGQKKEKSKTVEFILVMCLPSTDSGSRKLTDLPLGHILTYGNDRGSYAINQRQTPCSCFTPLIFPLALAIHQQICFPATLVRR